MVLQLALPDCPIPAERIRPLVAQMVADGEIIQERPDESTKHDYTPPFYHTEVALAKSLRAFVAHPISVDTERVQRWIAGYTERQQVQLSAQQCQAVELAAQQRVLILTGGP